MTKDEESSMARILLAWEAAPDGTHALTAHARVLRALTMTLENEQLAADGALTDKARVLIRRVKARDDKAGAK